MGVSRREFLKGGIAAGLYLSATQLLELSAAAANNGSSQSSKRRVLVIVQLNGGNDGLNMVIPHSDPVYYKQRPSISISQERLLKLTDDIALNPAMKDLQRLFSNEKLAVIQGVGYPNANRSHFRSIEIWQTAQPDKLGETGWLGRYLDRCDQCDGIFPAINLDPSLPKTLCGDNIIVPTIQNAGTFKFRIDDFLAADRQNVINTFNDIYDKYGSSNPQAELLRKAGKDAIKASDQLQELTKKYKSKVNYPGTNFGNSLKFIAQMITGNLPSIIYGANLDGFDTHANQSKQQDRLLGELSDGLAAFQQDLEEHGKADEVITLVFSEFGRRVAENGGKGTDHGTAGPVMLLGSKIKGGLYGEQPSLSKLDQGDLKYTVDFRSIYSTILTGWFGTDAKDILGHRFEDLKFV